MDEIRVLAVEVFNWSCCLNMKKPSEVKLLKFLSAATDNTR